MKEKEFKDIVAFRLNHCMEVLGLKATEYVKGVENEHLMA